MQWLKRYQDDDEGAAAIEYGLLIALLALACITTLVQLGTSLSDTYKTLANSLSSGLGVDYNVGGTQRPPSTGGSGGGLSGGGLSGGPVNGIPGGGMMPAPVPGAGGGIGGGFTPVPGAGGGIGPIGPKLPPIP